MRPGTVPSFAVGVALGGLLSASITFLAAPAKADPDSASIAYAATYGGIVCETLDAYPTFGGVEGVGTAIVQSGLSYRQAGYVIALSVSDICPEHLPLIKSYVQQYNRAGAVA